MAKWTLSLAAVGCLLIAACSSTSNNTGSSSAAEQACRDTADAVAKAALRCGQEYQTNYDAFVKCSANSDCANITQLRDESSLRNVCLPSLGTIQCTDLFSKNLDASCKGQLLHADFPTPSGC